MPGKLDLVWQNVNPTQIRRKLNIAAQMHI